MRHIGADVSSRRVTVDSATQTLQRAPGTTPAWLFGRERVAST